MLRVDHDCEINVKQDDLLFLPGRGPFRKILDYFRQFIMASKKSPSARKYLRSNYSISYEKQRHLRNFKEVIHPFSLFRYWWNILMIIVMIICFIIFPYHVAFNISSVNIYWTLSKNALYFILCCDIFVNLMTGYFDETQRIVVMEKSRRIRHYIYPGTLIPDLISSFPTDLFFIITWDKMIILREYCSLLVIFRIFSIYSYIRIFALAYDFHRMSYEIFNFFFWATILIHWQACLFWIIPIAVTSLSILKQPHKDSWINFSNLWNEGNSEKYYQCFIRVIATFTRCGFQKEEAFTGEDQYLIIVFQLLGTFVLCIMIARIMQYFQSANSSRLKYQAAIGELQQYMRYKQLPRKTQRRFLAYYEFRFQHQYFREAEILNTLSSQMRQEIRMHSCRKLVENVPFFNNIPLTLLARIVALLKSEIFLTNDVIVRANTPGDCMYFIATGTVAVYTASGKEVCHLEDGAHFGEIALVMPDEKRIASVVAVEVCELYRLERADFSRTIHPYPMLWERIKQIAMDRHEKTVIFNAQ
ncbi:potassium/sodium hyperpolarization-activated cyclic nucleotide-gated channel 1-like [Leptopilina boulardi]|uniref:potassium/sodium hyperpolarization-activated cyclic nucleotide-gated channel 1-like n=1 Tax=Leptopilina boulardi TaxID=63433 RepID=UPI0021F52502|nr:potassium/sodium hyperpolarization-activated cyclic nucleotide-gated channel 1-like [Leptopilina boulardi]